MGKTYLDLTGLSTYDEKIKAYLASADAVINAKSIKTVLLDGDVIKFYKKENATTADTEDYKVPIASSDVTALKNRVGMTSTLNGYQSKTNVTDIVNVLTGDDTVAGSVESQLLDMSNTILGKVDTKISNLESEVSSTDKDNISITINQEAGVLTSVTANVKSNTFDAYGAATAVQGSTTETVKSVNDKISALGTAAKKDYATTAIVESSTDESLVTAAQVSKFVADEVAGLTGAMHFRGVFDSLDKVSNPQAGDVAIVGVKEYVYCVVSGTGSWKELGDESVYVTKTTTIAGVDLQNNITKDELNTALGISTQISTAVNALDATVTQDGAATDGNGLTITTVETNGKLTSVSGSINTITTADIEALF